MHHTPPDTPRHVPVHDAARLIGISENAVRARLRRGTLAGVKHGTSWYVLIRDIDIPLEHTAVHVDLAPLAELIERQGRELAEMREAAAVWQIRARQAEERLLELTAGETAPETRLERPGSTETSESVLQGLRTWLRRLWPS